MKIRVNRVIVDGEPVEHTPRSTQSIRDVELHPSTLVVLKSWRKAQLAERLAAGDPWGVRTVSTT